MSKQANPLAIGTFLVGALILLTVGIMIFGGSDFFKEKNRFVIFFDSALNGLNVGAPVKLQGVQIGNVKEISLVLDSDSGRVYKPVVVEIDPELLLDLSGNHLSAKHSYESNQQEAERLTEAGLKARLETQSLLTGLLYVDLNFYHDKPVTLVNLSYKDLPQLASVPTEVDEIRNIADEIINKVRQLPLMEMVKNLSETLQETHDVLKSEEIKQSLTALAKSLQETQKLIATLNNQVGPLLGNVNATVAETQVSLRQMPQVLKAAEQSLNAAGRVLQSSQTTLNAVEAMAEPDSPLGQALLEMRNAARSMKDLSESLERHPEAILYGK